MDYSSLRKSFKGQTGNSSKYSKSNEELPNLYPHQSNDSRESPQPSTAVGRANHPEVIVKVDGSSSSSEDKPGREPSFGYMQREKNDIKDPASKRIGKFSDKKNVEDDEISLDMDIEMDKLRRERHHNSSPFQESTLSKNPSREIRVSFEPSVSNNSSLESVRRRYKDLQDDKEESSDGINSQQPEQEEKFGDEVLRCSSNSTFQTQSSGLSRAKTKSRLLDPSPNELDRIPFKSGQQKSELLGKSTDEDEDDPLECDDLPDKYKKVQVSTMTVLECMSLITIVALLGCTLFITSWKEKSFLELKLWKWEVLFLVLICGRLVSGWGIRIIVFFIERNFLLRKRVLYFVYGLRNGVQNCWWLGLVLLAWHFLFDKKVKRETNGAILKLITRILVCFLVANFVWLIKTLMVKVLASSFHVSTYFDRIQESIYNQYIIETLSGPPLIEIQKNEEEIEKTTAEIRKLQNAGINIPPDLKATVSPRSKSGRIGTKYSMEFSTRRGEKKVNTEITIDHLHKLNHKNISAWNMKRLMKIVRYGSLSTLEEQILDANIDDETAVEIRSEYEAKIAARKIFHNVAGRGSK